MANKKRQSTVLNSKLNLALSVATALYRHNRVTSVEVLSKELDVSVSYIEQVISQLRKGGIVKSIRGPGGGYQMAKKTILVRDVIRSINPSAFKCKSNQALHSALEAMMGDMKISDLCESVKKPVLKVTDGAPFSKLATV
ncbi:RrF2 family transcriptional regulator [Vibrio owensii]|uniref:RrF2 family transcriptional regulator n=1 Tax=Vibrio owensii TaxID=696485 RepID=UPI003CE4952A